jgi:tetratricopeptide (TPR) repeat protein
MAMGFVSWLFARTTQRKEGSHVQAATDVDQRFFDLPERSFYGQCAWSPDGRYKIAWGIDTRSANGKHGRYLLLHGSHVLIERKLARPDHGAVANNGSFVLCSQELQNALNGQIYAFAKNGERILRRAFGANIFNCGLSSDGRHAACQTCNSSNSSDGASLTLFDLFERKEVAQWIAESGWPDFYEFPEGSNRVGLGYRALGVFYYSLGGDFIDRPHWETVCLQKGTYDRTLLMIQHLLDGSPEDISAERYSLFISSLDRVTPELTCADSGWRALALKLRGLCLEGCGKLREALHCYDEALALDEKIGAKRRANNLRKILSR